jgi:LuxR family maltose regulon positive regulatory protein
VSDRSKTLRALDRFGGDDRVVADYIREEVLAGLSPDLTTFLVRTSVLARLSGDVCDHVLERRNSARLLRELSRMNVLLLPLDRTDTEYRYHPLLAQALRSELGRFEPELATKLHARASQWYEQAGNRDLAIDHAIDAGDIERAGHLLWSEAPSLLGYGHCHKLISQLRRFSREQLEACAPLALTAASAQLAAGDRALVEHWTAAATRRLNPRTPNGSLEGGLLVMRAAVSDAGLAATRDQAARAYALAGEASPWRSLACLVEGAARQLTGDRDGARALLEEGARRGAALAPAIQVLCLGQLALLAIDDDEWDAADLLTARAQAQIERVRIGDYPTAALVFAVSAAVHAHFGRLDACDRDVRQANRLLGELAGFTPWFTAECRIALAWAALRLSDQRTARQLLEQASYELRLVPEANVAHAWLGACRQQLDYVAGARSTDAESLTKAELRVLQFLPTHLSFLEIAEHLYVSTNTVKTHARAVYRKLAASSRSEAVLHARQAGLLEGSA